MYNLKSENFFLEFAPTIYENELDQTYLKSFIKELFYDYKNI